MTAGVTRRRLRRRSDMVENPQIGLLPPLSTLTLMETVSCDVGEREQTAVESTVLWVIE